MIPLGKLKQNVELNKSLGGIIEALKVGAAISLHQFQENRPLYPEFLAGLKVSAVMLEKKGARHRFFEFHKDLPRCIVGITSDEGFLGELNTSIINKLLEQRKKNDKDTVVVLGERGAGYLEDINVSFKEFPGIKDETYLEDAKKLKDYLIAEYLEGKFSDITIVYPKFISVSSQRTGVIQLLPVSFSLIAQVEGVDEAVELPPALYEDLLLEPSASDVVAGLVNLWSGYLISDIFWSSKLSELSARLMHLDSSEQELQKVNQKLNLEYFRHVHTLADKTIREISASRFLSKEEQ